MRLMSIQSRISVTLSPRMRKALELIAGLEGSSVAAYSTQLLTQAIKNEIKADPILSAQWIELEKRALNNQSWDKIDLPGTIDANDLYNSPAPKGWFLSGNNPAGYLVDKDQSVKYKGRDSGCIRSKNDQVTGFGTVMQQINVADYIGRKLEFSAVIKTTQVKGWAGLWVRIDDSNTKMLWFDNMQDRPITGTTDWTKFQIAFDVPEQSDMLNFGVLLVGSGSLWINSVGLVELKAKNKPSAVDLGIALDF